MFWKHKEEGAGGLPRKEWTTGAASNREPQPEPTESGLFASVPVLRPSLGPDTKVSGRLSFTVPTRIDGQLRGEVRASELLVVGEDALVEGTVRALKLVVLGEVRGDVRGAECVEIRPGGRLVGTIETHSLVVGKGAYLDGDCRIAPPRTALRVLRSAPAGT